MQSTKSEMQLTEAALAKVNLHLHVTGRRDDGYHLLQSLVIFPSVGDEVYAEASEHMSLEIEGPQSIGLSAGGENLVMRAAMALKAHLFGDDGMAPGAKLTLVKNLPVASGIGGGSADAAATLRVLNRLWNGGLDEVTLEAIALPLGADIPVCVGSRPRLMEGLGEKLSPVPSLPAFYIVLANPLIEVPTPAVFKALEKKDNEAADIPAAFADYSAMIEWLARQRNDLEWPAISAEPKIAELMAQLSSCNGCDFVRMSGSGATVFGIFKNQEEANAAALKISLDGSWAVAGGCK